MLASILDFTEAWKYVSFDWILIVTHSDDIIFGATDSFFKSSINIPFTDLYFWNRNKRDYFMFKQLEDSYEDSYEDSSNNYASLHSFLIHWERMERLIYQEENGYYGKKKSLAFLW